MNVTQQPTEIDYQLKSCIVDGTSTTWYQIYSYLHQLLKLFCIIFFSFNFTTCAMLSISVRGLSSIGKEQIIVID